MITLFIIFKCNIILLKLINIFYEKYVF